MTDSPAGETRETRSRSHRRAGLTGSILSVVLVAVLILPAGGKPSAADFAGLAFLVGEWKGKSEVELAPGAFAPAGHHWKFERKLETRDGGFLVGESNMGEGGGGISHHEQVIIGYDKPGRLVMWRFMDGGVFARAELKRQGEKEEWIAIFPPPEGNPGKIHDYRHVIRRVNADNWTLHEQTRKREGGRWKDALRGLFTRVKPKQDE